MVGLIINEVVATPLIIMLKNKKDVGQKPDTICRGFWKLRGAAIYV
jgi:hypothetical protein